MSEVDRFIEKRGEPCTFLEVKLVELARDLEAEVKRLEKVEAAAVEYIRDSGRPAPSTYAERFDKLVATLPHVKRLEDGDGDE